MTIEGILQQALDLRETVNSMESKLSLDRLKEEVEALTSKSQNTDFWSDNIEAQKTMKRISKLEQRLSPWLNIDRSLNEIIEMAQLRDESLTKELDKQIAKTKSALSALKEQLKYSGKYDDYDVILGIYAGAGGTDAQDWTGMLERMYLRWGEKNQLESKIIEESSGDEAGIKSVVIEFSGSLCYGRLKGEHGVHRLVRLSPFNADNLRQTSFAKVEVMPKIDEPDSVKIDEKDLKIDVYRSGGKGGQSVNTTDSAVRITHLPTGISVAIQNERSQIQNKETAMTILRSRLAQLQMEQHAEHIGELKGPNQSAEWGNQIRSYVLHPYKQVKDLRTKYETSDVDSVLDGKLDEVIEAFAEYSIDAS